MDINKWLADTAVSSVQPAKRPDQPGYPDETSPPKKAPVLDLPFSKREAKRRKDVSKDSSILASEDIPTEGPARRIVRQVHQHRVDNVPSEDAGHSSQREDEDDDGANPYQRRKRHKTKPDIYDPKPRKPSTGQEESGKQERKSRKKNKEAKHSKKVKSAPTLVRNYHAANVPRERLTLQPRANVGIFKKGKASSPFRGRGRGLPDLAFSEMNFLQKRRFPTDDVADTDEPNKRRKKDKKRATEEEISSYFVPKTPLLERSQDDAQARHEIRQRQSSTAPSIRAPVENPILPELGTLKDGPRSTSNTYFTWSDSLRYSSRPVVVRPASATDLEAYRARSASTPFSGTRVRASSYDIQLPDLLEHRRHPIRRQTTGDDSRRKIGDANTGFDQAVLSTTPSRTRLNQLRGLDLERTISASNELPPTTEESALNAASPPRTRKVRPTTQEVKQQESFLSDSSRIPQAAVSTPALESQDATSTSIANLLTECDTAHLGSTRTRTSRLQSANFDHRTRSRSTNNASTIRQNQDMSQYFRQSIDENMGEEVFEHEREGPLFVESIQQTQDPRVPEMRYYDVYEPSEVEETLDYMHQEAIEYQERVPPQATDMPTRWPRYQTQYNHVVQYGSMGGVPMSDLEDEAFEQLDFGNKEENEDEEEDDGLAEFWRPNMLY